ncbi:helix-turn-helix transcriptional regulator [Listeria seeligeri]|uniref:helix-turn-helix domain-containing protein n=1 Tax=Listeria TaxID=1637 RepID=UPI00139AFC07|nr:helix-turn-helix transcriptional regulator [Listeria seeligeri]EDP7604089.1 helix-turn-helix transcriptional regulator [Listeria monocytogenes]MBC6179053.1 helix-turn-helix transcriptional regulator [Listeria welshimeri]MBK1994942.1 helix-turn-helix transcriptional regulator [Listeria ivanovii subsp. londoniensis]EEO0668556.1 helix-turn-helix transcriptional regulator [Listeria monocytogenes]EEO9123662.1 helix-turn-helix transcriptional regulator [Listeria monocytogenes]
MFSDRLSKLRKKKGMSQYKLADELGFSRGQVANYEQGSREPDYSTLLKIAEYFNVTTDYLLGKEEVDNSDLLAAHIDDNLTEEERIEIEKYLKFIRSQK